MSIELRRKELSYVAEIQSSASVASLETLAIDRWNVEKKRAEWDAELKSFRDNQRARCKTVRATSNKYAVQLYERIFFSMRWSNPQLPMPQQQLILRFCDHYTSANPESRFPEEKLLRVWVDKQRGTPNEKTYTMLLELCDNLKNIVLRRNQKIENTVREYHKLTEKMTIKKDGELRWAMEKNKGKRDRFWTIWYLSSRNMLDELVRMCSNSQKRQKPPEEGSVAMGTQIVDINEKDPDFGMTALHYACKGNHVDVVKYLLQNGAAERISAPDGRFPLHFAAQYGGREIILELLSYGADYYAVDDYGCTALDLAIQNKNSLSIPILQEWTKLLPPESTPTPEPEEDLSEIPDEYLVTPVDILNKMSPMLQLLAKRLDGQTGLNLSADAPVEAEEPVELDGNGVPFLKAKAKRKLHSYGNKMDPFVELRLCQKHSRLCFHENFVSEGVKSLRRRWFVAKTYMIDNFNIVEDECLLNVDYVPRHEGTEMNPSVSSFQLSQICADNNLSDASAKVLNPVINLQVIALESALELVEKLVELQQEGMASVVLRQCVEVLVPRHAISVISVIALQSRRCEVLLCLHDLLQMQNGLDSPRTMTSMPKSGNNVVAFDKSSFLDEKKSNEMLKLNEIPVLNNASTLELTDTAVDRICNSVNNSYLADKRQSKVSAIQPNFLKSRLLGVLEEAQTAIEDAIQHHQVLHDSDIIEPCTLSPLLELLANVFERIDNDEEALKILQYANRVCCRTLGQIHEESLRVMLEMLRLQIRVANTKEGFKEAARLATEISRYLDALIKVNSDAAQIFAKKCAELLSLAKLLEHGDIVLPTSVSGGSSQLPAIMNASKSVTVPRSKFSSKSNIVNSPYGNMQTKKNGSHDNSSIQDNSLLNSLLYKKIVNAVKTK